MLCIECIQVHHTLQRRIQLPHAIMRCQIAHTHRQLALSAVHAPGPTAVEVVKHVGSRPGEQPPLHRTGDYSAQAVAHLVIVDLGWCAAERAVIPAAHHLGLEGELRPTLALRPRKGITDPEGLHAARSWGGLPS